MCGVNRYGLAVVLFSFVFLTMLATFNWLVDPYYLMGAPKIEGVNIRKTKSFLHITKVKPYVFHASDADSLILGSSRAGSAIDPQHPTLATDKFYNFATPGSVPIQDYLKLRSAIESREIKRILYCIDFYQFNRLRMRTPAWYDVAFKNRLPVNGSVFLNVNFLRQALQDFGGGLWAYNTLNDSINTVQDQKTEELPGVYFTLENSGLWSPTFASYRVPLEAFRLTESTYLDSSWFSKDSPHFSMDRTETALSHPFATFEELLALAYSENIETQIIILPVHARLLESLVHAGLWNHFEYWKREMVSLNEKVAGELGKNVFPLWDFNGYFPVATEVVPTDSSSTPLKWVYDSSHTHVNTGNRILDIIAGRFEVDFGAQITSSNIDEWLDKQRQQRDKFQTKNPELVNEIIANVEKVRKKNPWTIFPIKPSSHQAIKPSSHQN